MDNHQHILALLAQPQLTGTDRKWLLDHEQELRQLVQEQFIIALKTGLPEPSAHARATLEQLHLAFDQPAAKPDQPVHAQAIQHHHSDLPVAPVHRIRFLRTAWAAAILLLLGTGTYLYFVSNPKHYNIARTTSRPSYPEIPPGGNKAILTLADGRPIVLDTAANGTVAVQGNTKINKTENGSLAYDPEGGAGPAARTGSAGYAGYNTITTPRGGQYHVLLSDGSQVWLNAASSIRFPTAFVKDRKVAITGEVYFEIAKDKSRPFLVTAHGAEVTVLGTSFNINAYIDEPELKTTLIEGAVQVAQAREKVILQPGQQARIMSTANPSGPEVLTATARNPVNRTFPSPGAITVIGHPDLKQVLAWKNGAFNFQDASLEEVMRQLARWYDLDVVYEKGIPKIEFYGSMDRNLTLASVLDGLQMSRVHIKVEGRKMTIMP